MDWRTSILRGLVALAAGVAGWSAGADVGRPNILWIVSEDNNPYLGCYGDRVARTPVIDALAKAGVVYENCFSQAPVCAPSRFTLITGMYATSCGPANQMRAAGKMPAGVRGFPAYLRAAGYYTTNNAKTDYNAAINMKDAWDQSGKDAHWRNRPAGKPFFAVFNFEVTHESSLFGKYERLAGGTRAADVRIPAYCPDTPETRADRALYYDQHRRLDAEVGELLAQLKADGLEGETIVFYYGDNGGVLPRSKRFCYDSGLHVPLIVSVPSKWRELAPGAAGTRTDRVVSFVDFAPTVLAMAGVAAPAYFQGRAFAGKDAAPAGEYAFGFRDRMDERYDFVRTARNAQYRYIRNYRPDLPHGQHVDYMFKQEGYRVWEELYRAGKLNEVQRAFWEPKAEEELYDLAADPDEVLNLVGRPEHRGTLARMRAALRAHMLATRDNGFIPEGAAAEGYDGAHDERAYPMERVMALADLATKRDVGNLPRFVEALGDENEVIRYWAALGCVMLKERAAGSAEALGKAAGDRSLRVRVAAAEGLCWAGGAERGVGVLAELLAQDPDARVRLQAANALDHLGAAARPAVAALRTAGAGDADEYVRLAAGYTAGALVR